MWGNRWVRIGAVALGFFAINGLSRLISYLSKPHQSPLATTQPAPSTGQTVIAVVGALLVVALMAGAAAFWAMRYPSGRMLGDLSAAILGGTLLATLIGPFIGGGKPFSDGLESFVLQFLQFLALGALGIVIGFTVTVVLGKDWKSRGLGAYAERYGRRARTATDGRRR
jgi:hypothetical protein